MKDWAWHSSTDTVDDEVLKLIGDEHISFVFSLHVDGMPVKEPCGIVPDKPKNPSTAAIGIMTIWNGMKQENSIKPNT